MAVIEASPPYYSGALRGCKVPRTLRRDFVEVWDPEGFSPWEDLQWERVRVMRYRQHKADGTVFEAYWLTNFPMRLCGSRALFLIAKARWEIENQGFNDAKTRYGMEHNRHVRVDHMIPRPGAARSFTPSTLPFMAIREELFTAAYSVGSRVGISPWGCHRVPPRLWEVAR